MQIFDCPTMCLVGSRLIPGLPAPLNGSTVLIQVARQGVKRLDSNTPGLLLREGFEQEIGDRHEYECEPHLKLGAECWCPNRPPGAFERSGGRDGADVSPRTYSPSGRAAVTAVVLNQKRREKEANQRLQRKDRVARFQAGLEQ